jgi:hypothetical protein
MRVADRAVKSGCCYLTILVIEAHTNVARSHADDRSLLVRQKCNSKVFRRFTRWRRYVGAAAFEKLGLPFRSTEAPGFQHVTLVDRSTYLAPGSALGE